MERLVVALNAGGLDSIRLNFGQEINELTGSEGTGKIGPTEKILPTFPRQYCTPGGRLGVAYSNNLRCAIEGQRNNKHGSFM